MAKLLGIGMSLDSLISIIYISLGQTHSQVLDGPSKHSAWAAEISGRDSDLEYKPIATLLLQYYVSPTCLLLHDTEQIIPYMM